MSRGFFRVALDIPVPVRATLLRQYPPGLPVVLAQSVTWAYRVPNDFSFNRAAQPVVVYGIHRDARTEALLCRIGNTDFQPLQPTRPLHLTLSTAEGVPPVEAGSLDLANAILFTEPFVFTARLQAFALRRLAQVAQARAAA